MSYKVKEGDNLTKIAKQHGLSLQELMELNNISKDQANYIKVGQTLKINKTPANVNKPYFGNPVTGQSFLPAQNIPTIPLPYNPDQTKKQFFADNAEKFQQELKRVGYNLGTSGKNKDGVDGKWGKRSQAALDRAYKDGYIYKNGRLVKPEKTLVKRNNINQIQYQVHPMFGTPIPTVSQSPASPPAKGKAIYLHYPNFKGKASNALKIGNWDVGKSIMGDDDSLPVGHGETLLVDENGKVKYVRYGRYTSGPGHVRPSVKGGNWGIYDYPDMKPEETTQEYINRLLTLNKSGHNYLEDSKYGAFEAIEIPNVDYQKALNYATTQSNDKNRPDYSVFNTCATGACNTIEAGLPTSSKLKMLIPTFSGSDAEEVKGSSAWGWIPGSTNKYAQDMRDLGTSYIFNKSDK